MRAFHSRFVRMAPSPSESPEAFCIWANLDSYTAEAGRMKDSVKLKRKQRCIKPDTRKMSDA